MSMKVAVLDQWGCVQWCFLHLIRLLFVLDEKRANLIPGIA